jgi:hypothetical protein
MLACEEIEASVIQSPLRRLRGAHPVTPWSSSTIAGVPLGGLGGTLPTEGAGVHDTELSGCTAGIDGSAACESWLA